MRVLVIVNDPPYGTERMYNGLRLATTLAGREEAKGSVTVFLMADAVTGAKRGQKTPDGFYNVERMLKRFLAAGGTVLLCGTCMDARGLAPDDLIEGVRRSTMDELAAETVSADRTLVF